MPRRKFTDDEIAELVAYVDRRVAEGVRPSVACREFAETNRYDDQIYYSKWYSITKRSKGDKNMNTGKIVAAYRDMLAAFQELGLEPHIDIWVHDNQQDQEIYDQALVEKVAESISKDGSYSVDKEVHADSGLNGVRAYLGKHGTFYATVLK